MAYKSGLERTLAHQLESLGATFSYETLELPYIIDHVYLPDFILPNGVIIEAKGVLNKYRNNDTGKMVAVKKAYPHLDIRFVFQTADKKVCGQKSTNEQWATRNGFPYAIGKVPVEWTT